MCFILQLLLNQAVKHGAFNQVGHEWCHTSLLRISLNTGGIWQCEYWILSVLAWQSVHAFQLLSSLCTRYVMIQCDVEHSEVNFFIFLHRFYKIF